MCLATPFRAPSQQACSVSCLARAASGGQRRASGGCPASSPRLLDTAQVSQRMPRMKRCAADGPGTTRWFRWCTILPRFPSRTFCSNSGSLTTRLRGWDKEMILVRSTAAASTAQHPPKRRLRRPPNLRTKVPWRAPVRRRPSRRKSWIAPPSTTPRTTISSTCPSPGPAPTALRCPPASVCLRFRSGRQRTLQGRPPSCLMSTGRSTAHGPDASSGSRTSPSSSHRVPQHG
mmetsp:Transcript_52282/g.87258  ORF Transcript_52282/g.87258 Transcript_52282/m.87258 type:complete len:232 (+) Transcript_52282:115-810(+)